MSNTSDTTVRLDLPARDQYRQLVLLAARRTWGWALLLIGWLHLLAFLVCDFLTMAGYHESSGYLAIWLGELAGMWLIFRSCAGPRIAEPTLPLELFIRRVWIAYFLLAFNLGSMNTLRGHALFEFFPATASLASFAFLMMTFVVSRRFFPAVVVMFAAGLLMAAHLLIAYLIFALAWWLVLSGVGVNLIWKQAKLAADGTKT
jgi:hypothetical protein